MMKLLILPGDGIGPEIMPEVKKIALWFKAQGVAFELDEEPYGIPCWKAHGTLMPEAIWQKILEADAILFGATGSPEYEALPAEARRVDYLLKMRRDLDLYTNLRPIRLIPGMEDASTLRPEVLQGTDMVLVRELTGGLYFGEPRGIERAGDGTGRGFNTLSYTTREVERIAREAFELARTRDGRVCNVDKSNVLETFMFWRQTVIDLHRREYPDIELTHMYVDNCAMQLVRRPAQFDVLVTENLFGDILSDCAAMVAGSLGMLPSASLGPTDSTGRRRALYEPIHGSAPDIAGRGIANPCGAILSFALCLRHTFKAPGQALRLEAAVEQVIAKGLRTADIAQPGARIASTQEMGAAILAALEFPLAPESTLA
jgi:3-isopropylmalate dehydrogenase